MSGDSVHWAAFQEIRIMFKHILVPIDGSPTAGQAISKALAIAQAFNSAVTLIYVI